MIIGDYVSGSYIFNPRSLDYVVLANIFHMKIAKES